MVGLDRESTDHVWVGEIKDFALFFLFILRWIFLFDILETAPKCETNLIVWYLDMSLNKS